jgi:hypothetical protein
VRTINQRLLVDVAAAAAFGDACGLRWGDEGEGGAVVLSVDDVRAAAGGGGGDVNTGQWRMIASQCVGAEAMAAVCGMDAVQLQAWLLEHFCRPHPLPWPVAARIIMYLCISIDGLSLPLLLDLILFDHARDTLPLPPTIKPAFLPLIRAALPIFVHACTRARVVCASQRSDALGGLLWRVATPDVLLLLPLLEVAAGVEAGGARASLLEYFEGHAKRFAGRLRHVFHNQSAGGVQPGVETHDSSAADADAAADDAAAASTTPASTPSAVVRRPPPPPFNLRRMREGVHAALTLGKPPLAAAQLWHLLTDFPCVCRRRGAGHRVRVAACA